MTCHPGVFKRNRQILMLLFNYFPLVHVLMVIAAILLRWEHIWEHIVAGVSVLYLLPPLLARVVRLLFPLREGRFGLNTKEFIIWWALLCLQVTYCRFPFLEELLRLVPGLYSMWLRLWGASVGGFTYWAAGTIILDRTFVKIGDDVILGAGVRINPHVIQRRSDGELELVLGTVTIGHRAVIGGYSLLTAGTEISSGEITHAFLISPPFNLWKGGKRIKPNIESRENPKHTWPTK